MLEVGSMWKVEMTAGREPQTSSKLISRCHPLSLSHTDFLALREIDIDLNMKVSFIEYCLFK